MYHTPIHFIAACAYIYMLHRLSNKIMVGRTSFLKRSVANWYSTIYLAAFTAYYTKTFFFKTTSLWDFDSGDATSDFTAYCIKPVLSIISFTFQCYRQDDTLQVTNERTTTHCIVMRLLEGYERNDHHVYMDNYYTSPALFLEMAQNGFGAYGTARVNRQGVRNGKYLEKERV